MVTPTPLAKQKKKRNWIGIGSLIFGLLSWVLFPIILGLLAVIIGIVAVWSAKKAGSKIPVSAIVGIIIGLLAIVLNYFWFAIFPPPTVLPPIK
jgi:Na+/H+-dicarboxylate symporter